MPRKGPLYLTKSRFQAGLYCPKRLWLDCHAPRPYEEAAPGTPQAVGSEVGGHAQKLFPGGVLIDEEAYQHRRALERTLRLIRQPDIPALFEAAFEYDGVRIRADIIERCDSGVWRLHEVKSSTHVKPEYLTDVAVQYHVMRGNGLDVSSAGVLHIDAEYERGDGEIDWTSFFTELDVTDEVMDLGQFVEEEIDRQKEILDLSSPPKVTSGRYCKSCDFLDHCTAHLGDDWICWLPRLTEKQFGALDKMGVERISHIPPDFHLNATQEKVRKALTSGEEWVSPDLDKALRHAGPPSYYLDFETMNPAIPVYPGNRPYQRVPFQWSLHHVEETKSMSHEEFLAEGSTAPHRPFAESLIDAIGTNEEPILVYSSFEKSVITDLASRLPDLKIALEAILDRLFDLLPITRGYIYHPGFAGSFSIKTVAPALVPDLSYKNLGLVSDGQAAAAAFVPVANGELSIKQEQLVRQALLDYCKLDTLAMVKVHQALVERIRKR